MADSGRTIVVVDDLASNAFDPAGPRPLSLERAWPWVLRVVWFGLAPVVGQLLGVATDRHSDPVKFAVLALSGLAWAASFLATLIAHPIGLVIMRCTAPAVVAAALWAALDLNSSDNSHAVLVVVGVVWAIAAAGTALHPETGHLHVNGPAYPNERRFLLRPGALFQVVVIPLSAALLVAGVVTGVFLLAAKRWVIGVPVLLIGWAEAFILSRSLYALAKRFVVFVPAGFVLHDVSSVREPHLFRRMSVESIGAAPADTDALDLTQAAAGLAVEIRFREKVDLTLSEGRDRFREGRSARFLIVPTLPGRLLAEAAERRYPTIPKAP